MLVCGICYRKGRTQIFKIEMTISVSVKIKNGDFSHSVLSNMITLVAKEAYSCADVICANCGNDFLVPEEWIKLGKHMEIQNAKNDFVCRGCGNRENFDVIVRVPQSLKTINGSLVFYDVMSRGENTTVVEIMKQIDRIVNGPVDVTVPLMCSDCQSSDVQTNVPKHEISLADTKTYYREVLGTSKRFGM